MQEGFNTGDPQGAPPVEVVPTSDHTPISPSEAARALAQYRYKRDAREDRAAEAPEQPAADAESAASPDEPAAAVEAEAQPDQAEELPPIEPPRSWSNEEKERFASLPRETQEYLTQRETERDTALRRGQNETAEQRKAIEAERQQLEQTRQQYEQALPTLLATLQQAQSGDFSDIKTMQDVERLAREDWPRYALWDAHQKKISAVQQEMQASQQRQQQQYQTEWAKWATDEDNKFLDAAPEMANKETAAKVTKQATDLLTTLGFSESDIGNLWSGRNNVSLRDHRVQLLIRDAMRYREAKAAVPKAAAPKPVAKVQRPGTPAERATERDTQLTGLDKTLEDSGSIKDGLALLVARRSGRR